VTALTTVQPLIVTPQSKSYEKKELFTKMPVDKFFLG
jgi:hypothetical protein